MIAQPYSEYLHLTECPLIIARPSFRWLFFGMNPFYRGIGWQPVLQPFSYRPFEGEEEEFVEFIKK